jgi:hypothetical protein
VPDEIENDRITDMLPEGYMSLGFVATVKSMRPDGEVVFRHVTQGGLNTMELIGMVTSLQDDLRDDLRTPHVHLLPEGEND